VLKKSHRLGKIVRKFRESFPQKNPFFLNMGELFAHFEKKKKFLGKIQYFPEIFP